MTTLVERRIKIKLISKHIDYLSETHETLSNEMYHNKQRIHLLILQGHNVNHLVQEYNEIMTRLDNLDQEITNWNIWYQDLMDELEVLSRS